MDKFDLLPLLNYISSDDYEVWYQVGMALKTEGYSCEDWDKWSQGSSKYHPGDCEKKWNSFQGEGVTGAFITMLAKEGGWEPSKTSTASEPRFLAWDAVIGKDTAPIVEEGFAENEPIPEPPKNWNPKDQLLKYINTLFQPDDIVAYCVKSAKRQDEEGKVKYYPANSGVYTRTAADICKDLEHYDDITYAIGDFDKKAGAWIRFNPFDGQGVANANVVDYRYALVECDDISLEKQYSLIKQMQLPVACLVHSGGKSIHAIVKVNAIDKEEYAKKIQFLYQACEKSGLKIDTKNKNPSRLSRMPGIERNGKKQYLIATNIGCESWDKWIDYIGSLDDDLPDILDFGNQLSEPPKLSPELIGGILREGNKMIITGESKAGKTCLSQELAVCIAEGKPWLGKFPCQQGKVLYINLEVEEASLFHRFKSIYLANGWELGPNTHNIRPWNLRGFAVPLEKLAAKVIRRCKNTGPYKAIILDPLYKVQQGDENSAEAIAAFCNALDKIAHETGAAIIYDHHHPKGAVGNRKIIDRGSGSGVFARDADAICDLSFLEPDKVILETIGQQIADGEKPMQVAFVLRDFKDVEPINIFFKFPIHYVDTAGLLDGANVEGSTETNIQNTNKKTAAEKRQIIEDAFEAAQENGIARIRTMASFTEVSEKTLRKYIEESPLFELDKGAVRRVDFE